MAGFLSLGISPTGSKRAKIWGIFLKMKKQEIADTFFKKMKKQEIADFFFELELALLVVLQGASS